MKQRLIDFTAIVLLMLITGVFWGTWFTLTRSLEDFSAEEFTHIGKVIIANVAMPMRILMPSGILLVLLSLWFHRHKKTTGFFMGVLSFILIIVVLLITLVVLVPIDNDIKQWTSATVPANWEALRDKWKLFHALRTFTSLLSFTLFSWYALTDNAD
jgi:hypothetical protein